MKYFVFNKVSDYDRGSFDGCFWDGEGISVSEGSRRGIYISRVLDSREQGTMWHRIVMDTDGRGDASLQFSFYSSDEDVLWYQGKQWRIGELITSGELSGEDKRKALAPFLRVRALNPRDILLHQISGRYFWFLAEIFGKGTGRSAVRGIRVYFPRETWLSYLPAVYGEEKKSAAFLEQFLGIFQSMYQDMERKIEHSGAYMDPAGGDEKMLRWIAGWLDISAVYLWRGDRLRKLLEEAADLFSMRGTRQGLIRLVELYTGEKPLVVEPFQVREFLKKDGKGECLRRLYGDDGYTVLLLVREERIARQEDYQAVCRIAETMVPAHISVKIMPLKSMFFLGNYSYLGINSRLGHYRPLRLDGLSLLPFTAVAQTQGGEQ